MSMNPPERKPVKTGLTAWISDWMSVLRLILRPPASVKWTPTTTVHQVIPLQEPTAAMTTPAIPPLPPQATTQSRATIPVQASTAAVPSTRVEVGENTKIWIVLEGYEHCESWISGVFYEEIEALAQKGTLEKKARDAETSVSCWIEEWNIRRKADKS